MSRWHILTKEQLVGEYGRIIRMGVKLVVDGPGCYVIKFGSGQIYIGSSSWNVRGRLYSYKPWVEKLGVEWIKWKETTKYGDWAMDELRLIKRLQPELNKMHSIGNGQALHTRPLLSTPKRKKGPEVEFNGSTQEMVEHLKELIKLNKWDEVDKLTNHD